MLNFRFLFKNTKSVSSIRFCHNERKQLLQVKSLEESQKNDSIVISEPQRSGGVMVQYWNERAAVRKEKRTKSVIRSINNSVDLMRTLQNIRNFPLCITEMLYYFKRRRERLDLIEQQYLPRRVAILKSDLAAAHFLVARGGSVKFKGQQEWIGMREKKKLLPMTYIPGMFVEAINAEGTNLIYEGLPNLSKLKYLTYLSLKNLKTINDWCIDWISKDHCANLKHLDISGCVNVTYRALSCFYRFECLETLNVEGIPDTIEFKVACLMLLEIMPHLDIKGIDLSIPEKIDGAGETKVIPDSSKQIPDSNKQIQDSGKQIQQLNS